MRAATFTALIWLVSSCLFKSVAFIFLSIIWQIIILKLTPNYENKKLLNNCGDFSSRNNCK